MYKPLDKIRVLVRVLIKSLHKVSEIILGFKEKIAIHMVKLLILLLDA